MVDVSPFKAFRYASKKSRADISKFICPPYDVISPEGRKALIRKSKKNVVQLELPGGTPLTKYKRAAATLKQWKKQNILQQDDAASFYLLETTYRIKDAFAPKSQLKRYGVLVALRLERPGKGKVRPHEKTLPKAKKDRLKLFNAVRSHISPIFGLFFDPKKSWSKWVKKATRKKAIIRAKESATLSHRLWKVDDPKLIKELVAMTRSKELYIADGHHRYEVSWAYRTAQSKKSGSRRKGSNFVMTYICPMEEAGLLMLPTHRLVKSNKRFVDWVRHLEPTFRIQPMKNLNKMITALQRSKPKDRVIGWVTPRGPFLLRLKKSINTVLSKRPRALRALDVVLLHDVIMEEAKGATYVKDQNLFFRQDIAEMLKKSKKDPSLTGFVLRSAGVASLAKVASAGQVMPPKTTYFYPKVPTGFTLMDLNGDVA